MNKKINFEESLERLEEITKLLENGDMTLDESLRIFEEGIKLSRLCENKLTEVEHKIEILKNCDISDNENEIILRQQNQDENSLQNNSDFIPNENIKKQQKIKIKDETNLLF